MSDLDSRLKHAGMTGEWKCAGFRFLNWWGGNDRVVEIIPKIVIPVRIEICGNKFTKLKNDCMDRSKTMNNKIFTLLFILLFSHLTFAQSGLVGHWSFDDAQSPLKADVGKDLSVNGSNPVVVDGPSESNGAVRVYKGSNLIVEHGIDANGGGSKVNEYTIVMDISLPAAPASNRWYCMYQTNSSNSDDGDWFINGDARMGVGAVGYTNYLYNRTNEWYRIAVSVKNGIQYNYYSDGIKRLQGTPGAIDGRFSFSSKFLLFADQNGEDNSIDVADVKLYSRALSDEEIEALGGYAHPEIDTEINPYLQSATDTSIYICWNAYPGEDAVVEYGTDGSLGHSATGSVYVFPDSSRWWHTVKLTGLTPSTTYYYKAKSGDSESDIYRFTTQPAPGDTSGHFRFIVIGDNQRVTGTKLYDIVQSIQQTITNLYGSSGLDSINLLINVGDIVNDGRVLSQYDDQFFKPLEPLTPYIPTMVSIGNHEREAENYYQYMKYEDFAGPEGEPYYTYKVGRIRFIAMNTNKSSDMELDYEFNYRNFTQISWLTDVLSETQTDDDIDWVFTYFHHPGHTEISPPSARLYVQAQLIPTLAKYDKAEMAIYGHAHDYERGALPEGNLRLMLVGGSGSYLERWGDYDNIDYPEIQKTFDHYCYSIIDIDAAHKKYIARSYSLGHDNKRLANVMIDSFYRDKNAPPPPKPNLVSPDSGSYVRPDFWVEAQDLSGDYDIMSAQLQITDKKGDYRYPRVNESQDFEDIYKDSGSPYYNPIDVNEGIELNKFLVTYSSFIDGKTYWWRVRYRDKNLQWSEWSDEWSFINGEPQAVSDPSPAVIKETKLYGNYPNPFNPATTIRFALKDAGNVSLKIYSIDGRLVKTLVNDNMPSGDYKIFWNGMDDNNIPVPTGTYLYRIEADNYTKTMKALLIK